MSVAVSDNMWVVSRLLKMKQRIQLSTVIYDYC